MEPLKALSHQRGDRLTLSAQTWKYDVFVSFRGETRGNFADHLCKELKDEGIKVFRDRELERGKNLTLVLRDAIKESKLAIIILSPDYASSTWCLQELSYCLKHMKNREGNLRIIPLFYKVEPSDVRKQRGTYHESFKKHEENADIDRETLQQWRSDLTEVSGITGWTSKDWTYETEFIAEIAQEMEIQLRICKFVKELPGICASCHKRIDDEEFYSYMGEVLHLDCFLCDACHRPLTDNEEFWELDDHFFHKSCYKVSDPNPPSTIKKVGSEEVTQLDNQVPQQVTKKHQPSATSLNGAADNAVDEQLISSTSLYVTDLDENVTDGQLYDLFNAVGIVVSVRVCRDPYSGKSLGYGYVNYINPQDAAKAKEVLNFTLLQGKSIWICYCLLDRTVRKSGTGNIFVKNLPNEIDNRALYDLFSLFGSILSCKVATDASGQSKGYGFVQYYKEEASKSAIETLNGKLLNDKQVFVGPFLRKQEREAALQKTKFSNVFVKNISKSTTADDLKRIFGEHGPITSAVVMRDDDGKSRGFGFVNFSDSGDAAKSIELLNGKQFDGKVWHVGKAQKKAEREAELEKKFGYGMKKDCDKFQGRNLYVKNLDDNIDDEKLKMLFSEYGTLTSCKVMRDPEGVSRGFGFVALSTSGEASRALTEMKWKMVAGKPLYVALAERKEDRRARLQAQFSQLSSEQFLYGPEPPQQAGFGYQQVVPGLINPGAPMTNVIVPMVQLGQQNQQQVPQMPQNIIPRGHSCKVPEAPSSGDMLSLSNDQTKNTETKQNQNEKTCMKPVKFSVSVREKPKRTKKHKSKRMMNVQTNFVCSR